MRVPHRIPLRRQIIDKQMEHFMGKLRPIFHSNCGNHASRGPVIELSRSSRVYKSTLTTGSWGFFLQSWVRAVSRVGLTCLAR